MKKYTKIVLVALSVALMLGAAIGFGVSAQTAAPEIVSKNVKVDGNYSLMFAVDPETVAGDDVTLTIYAEAPVEGTQPVQTLTKAKTDTTLISLDGDRVYDDAMIVFETAGVSAKDIADVWYITTSSAGVTSDVETYSVREYAFERLYKNGTIFATAEDADLYKYYQQQFYFELLEVGSAAQELLVNYKLEAEGKAPEVLAKDYTYVSVADGSFTAGDVTAARGFVDKGASVTLTPDNAAVTDWNVYTFNENGALVSEKAIEVSDTLTVEGNTVVLPYVAGVTAGKYFAEIGNPVYKMNNINWKDYPGGSNGTNLIAHTSFSSGTNSITWAADSGAEKYDKVTKLNKNPAAETDPTNYKNRLQGMLHFPIAAATVENANCVVTEFDFRYTNHETIFSSDPTGSEMIDNVFVLAWSDDDFMTTNGIAYNDWTSSSGVFNKGLSKNLTASLVTVDYDGQLTDQKIGGDAFRLPSSNGKKVDLLPDTWYNICFEIYTDVNKMLIYVDGELASIVNLGDKNIDEFNTFTMMLDGRLWRIEASLDNMFSGKVAKDYPIK